MFLAAAMVLPAVTAQAVTIDMVPVGDLGNAADTAEHSGNPDGQGAVAYTYQIGKYEVTAGQYIEFLNAVGGVDTYALYNTQMSRTDLGSGIARSGGGTVGNPYSYTVPSDWANRPVNYVSFWDAARFANWLNNGQGDGNTETGAYTLNGYNGNDGHSITRNPGAKWFIPSEDEWYKAAYYKGGGTNAGYWDYPTKSNTAPSNVGADGYIDPGNHANYWNGSNFTIGSPYYRTNVGEFENSASAYGTYDQGGNVWEYNETYLPEASGIGSSRGMRGGYLYGGSDQLAASFCYYNEDPTTESWAFGFRVAGVPEPGSLAMLAGIALTALLYWWRKRA
jgi:formylglycine-generating enzyme required for sulfatase activity